MVKFDENGNVDAKNSTFKSLVDYHAGQVMLELVQSGGKGLRDALMSAMIDAVERSKAKELTSATTSTLR